MEKHELTAVQKRLAEVSEALDAIPRGSQQQYRSSAGERCSKKKSSLRPAYATPIIMMSQNVQDKIATRRNRLDLQINLLAEQEGTEALRLLRKLCEQAGIKMDEASQSLEDATRPEDVVQQFDKGQETGA